MTRKITIPPILPETFEKIIAPWLTGIMNKDIVAVMSYPASDRQRRMLQLQSDKKIQKIYLEKPNRYLWISVDFRVDPIDDVIDLERHIQRVITVQTGVKFQDVLSFEQNIALFEKKTKKKIILVCFGCEHLLQKHCIPLLIWFTIQSRVDRICMLLFFEANLFSPQAFTLFGKVPAFQPRISTLTLYKESDVRQFLFYLEKKWSMKVSDSMKDDIIKACGGVFLLIKESMWYLRDHTNATVADVFNHTEMQFNLALLWNGFGREEQQVFDAIITRQDLIKTQHASARYLEKTGFLEKKGTRFVCTVPILLDYRREIVFLHHQLTLGRSGEIHLDTTNISTHFSRAQRRILTCFIQKRSKLTSRNEIAGVIWPVETENRYSDWAIDSHVSRLRTKLLQLGIPEESIRTIKGKGFVLNQKESGI